MLLQIFNWFIMLLEIMFQSPLLPCPYTPVDRDFLSIAECLHLRHLNYQMDGGKSLRNSSYYFLITSIGLEKKPSGYLPSMKMMLMGRMKRE